jgi:DNA-binding transcriptional LysR family regulator
MHIDFLGVRAFLEIAESGTFALAAKRLHLTQAAVSHRIRKLEEALQVQLIVRTARGVSLTQAGEALLPRARQSTALLEQSLRDIEHLRDEARLWVSIACIPTVLTGIVGPVMQAVARDHPGLRVRLLDTSPGEVVELVQSGEAAFGVTLDSVPAPGLAASPIGSEPFLLACSPRHRLAGRTRVEWKDLTAETLIRIGLPAGNVKVIEGSLGTLRERIRWSHEVQRTALALQMVRCGIGSTIVPALAAIEHPDIAYVALDQPQVVRQLTLVTPTAPRTSPALQEGTLSDLKRLVVDVIREQLQAHERRE